MQLKLRDAEAEIAVSVEKGRAKAKLEHVTRHHLHFQLSIDRRSYEVTCRKALLLC